MIRFFAAALFVFFAFSASAADSVMSPATTVANSFLQPAEGIRRVSEKLSLNFEGKGLSPDSASQRASRWVAFKEKKAKAEALALAAEAAAIDAAVEEGMLVEVCEVTDFGKSLFCINYRLDDEDSLPINGRSQQFFCPYADFDPNIDFYTCRGMAIDALNQILDLHQAKNPIARLKYQVFRTQSEIFFGKRLEGENELLRVKMFDNLIRTGDLVNGTQEWGLQQYFQRVAEQQVLGGGTEN